MLADMPRQGDKDIQEVMRLSLRLKEVQDSLRLLEEEEATLKAQIRTLLRADEAPEDEENDKAHASGSNTLAAAIVSVLDDRPGVPLASEEIAALVTDRGIRAEIDSVRSTLARLAKKERIAKSRRRGMYESNKRLADYTGSVAMIGGTQGLVGVINSTITSNTAEVDFTSPASFMVGSASFTAAPGATTRRVTEPGPTIYEEGPTIYVTGTTLR